MIGLEHDLETIIEAAGMNFWRQVDFPCRQMKL